MTDHTDPSGQDLRQQIAHILEYNVGNEISDDDHRDIIKDMLNLFEKHTAAAISKAERRAYGLVRAKQIYFDQVGWTASANNLEEVLAALRQGGNGEGNV